jgi:SAM-dependent methyltransferase
MNSKKINFDMQDINYLSQIFNQTPYVFFNIPLFRRHIAFKRWIQDGKKLEFFNQDKTSENVCLGTIKHNCKEFEENSFASFMRTNRLISSLASISPVFEIPNKLKVLSIGPRTEMEILHLLGIGFLEDNIYSIDLIKSSPYITLADMHKIPFNENIFDVVISSWVINYSNNPKLVLSEMARVCKPEGLLCLGATHDHNKESFIETKNKPGLIDGSSFGSIKSLLKELDEKYKLKMILSHEPKDAKSNKLMMIARLIEKN